MGPEPHSPPASEHPALLLGQGGERSTLQRINVLFPSRPFPARPQSPPHPRASQMGQGFLFFF